MRSDLHTEQLMATVMQQRDAILSRRSLLGRGALVGAATGAMALGLSPALRANFSALAQDDDDNGDENGGFEDDIAVLNYALTLEHLESTFYREGLEQFDDAAFEAAGFLGDDGPSGGVRSFIVEIGNHEAEHVEVLTSVIESLDGEPVEEAEYDFGYERGDVASFLAIAAALENTGVSAYTGAAQYAIGADEILTAALTIHGVEARHAAYLNVLNGTSPFPESFDPPLTPDEVLEIATPFIVS